MTPATVALVLFPALVLVIDAFRHPKKQYICGKDFALTLGHACVEEAFSGDYKNFQYHYGYERHYYKMGVMQPRMTQNEKLIKVYTPRKSHFCPSWSEMESDCCRGSECSQKRLVDLCDKCFARKWIKNKR